MRSGSDVIEEIKSRIDIVDVVSRVVDLKKAGRNYKGLCPFHSEKTPSFVVSGEKQIFTCFGCGKTGDVITFEQEYSGLDFMGAVEKLAEECGVTVDLGRRDSGNRDELFEINRQAARFFYVSMRKNQNPGMDYMTGRGIMPDTLKEFGIGYADGSWDSLLSYLSKCGFSEERMMELGLVSKSKGKFYDKFRNRVIFPIVNTRNKVIGFGGRSTGDAMPKYLNSSESAVFLKKNNLYGLPYAKNAIGENDLAILVEGYMDVIALHQAGVKNALASLGTALTENQAKLLNRYTKNVVLCYDADSAGQAAALRGMDILKQAGLKVRVMHVTDGKDPDEFIKKRGKNAFLRLVEEALPFADYKIKVIGEKYDLSDTQQRISFLEEAAAVLNQLDPVEADIYIGKLSRDYGISESALRSQQQIEKSPARPVRISREQVRDVTELSPVEKNLLKILVTDPAYIDRDEGIEKVFDSPAGKRIFSVIRRLRDEKGTFDQEDVEERLDPADMAAFRDVLEKVLLGSMDQVFSDCLRSVRKENLREEEEMIIARLSLADEKENKEEVERLTERLVDIQKQLVSIGQ